MEKASGGPSPISTSRGRVEIRGWIRAGGARSESASGARVAPAASGATSSLVQWAMPRDGGVTTAASDNIDKGRARGAGAIVNAQNEMSRIR